MLYSVTEYIKYLSIYDQMCMLKTTHVSLAMTLYNLFDISIRRKKMLSSRSCAHRCATWLSGTSKMFKKGVALFFSRFFGLAKFLGIFHACYVPKSVLHQLYLD